MSDYRNAQLIVDIQEVEPGEVTWRSPSNIALVKYWGKHGIQHPRNASVSFTLSQAVTDMHLTWAAKTQPHADIDLQFSFHGEPNEVFRAKIIRYLNSLREVYPFLTQLSLDLKSGNSFPHSSGIASSASSMSALALCLCSLEDALFDTLGDDQAFERKASYLARLGSGSACRSIYGYGAFWGQHPALAGSSDDVAIPVEDRMHEVFKTFHDDILIVSAAPKAVSSRAGHALMDEHAFAQARYTQAGKRIEEMLAVLQNGDLPRFGHLLEAEALTLHGLMMSSEDPFSLLLPHSLEIMDRVRRYRMDTGQPLYFTLDAGPNVHLLYPDEIFIEVTQFIEDQLLPFCADRQYIQDEIGEGPEQL